MKITWSPRAQQDLVRIAELIARDKRQAAIQWAETIQNKIARLKDFPKSGRVVAEIRREAIREIIVGSYRVIYKLEKSISILTIFHGAKGSLSL